MPTIHYWFRGLMAPVCSTGRRESAGFGTRDWSEVTCKRCLAKRPKPKQEIKTDK